MQQRAFDNKKFEFIWSSEVIKIGGAIQIIGGCRSRINELADLTFASDKTLMF